MNYYMDYYNIFFMIYFLGFILFVYTNYQKYLTLVKNHEDLFNNISSEKETNEKSETTDKQNVNKPDVPYEEKYLIQVRNMMNEYVFSPEELVKEQLKLIDLIQNKKNNISNEIAQINDKIGELKNKLRNLDDEEDEEEIVADRDSNDDSPDDVTIEINKKYKDEMFKKKLEDIIQNEIKVHNLKLIQLQNTKIDEEELKNIARQFIIDEQLQKYKKNFIIEQTPLGNVLMFYNHDKITFEYYSDVTIPYRFLETVARKYVITYGYRPLYIDMEEELKNYEKNLEQMELKENKNHDNEFSKDDNNSNIKNDTNNDDKKKKNVFAKFKTYNKEAGTGKVNMAPPPKNSIPQGMVTVNLNENKKDKEKNKSEKILLKERSNRYSYQGKLVNFNILQKIDRKKVDKKFALTFADFKKLNLNSKI